MKREFDARIRKVGNSYVITVPSITIQRFGLKVGDFLTVSVEYEEHKKDEK